MSIFGDILGFISGNEAADAGKDAARANRDLSREIYQDQTERQEPFRQGGLQGLNGMLMLMGLPGVSGLDGGGGSQIPGTTGLVNIPGRGLNGDWRNTPGRFSQIDQFGGYQQNGDQGTPYAQPGQPGQTGGQPSGPMDPMEFLKSTPGYQHRYQTGVDALDNSAAARGGLRSGAHMKDLTAYGQNFATGEYDNAMRRFASLMNPGISAANSQNAAAGQMGQNVMAANNQTANADIARWSNYSNSYNNVQNTAQNALMSGFGG